MQGTPGNNSQSSQQSAKIFASSFAAKYKSKRDIYYFLTVDVGAYLPHIDCVTIYFIRDIISNKKKYVKCDKVTHVFVPQYENLTLKEIGIFINEHISSMDYFPETKEVLKLPKQWIVNTLGSVIGLPFKQWVRERIEARNMKRAVDKNINIDIDPVILDIFNKSTHHTTSRGNGANLLKSGAKRRRTKEEIKQQKEDTLLKEQAINQKLQQFDNMQRELNELKSQMSQGFNSDAESSRHVGENRLKLKGGDFIIKGGTICTQKSLDSQMKN